MSRPRLRLTVRDRILAAVLALTALALLVSGGTAWVLQRDRVDASIEAGLERTRAQLVTLAESGVDPETGLPFADAGALLYAMMSREVPGANEGLIAFVGDRLRYRTQDIGLPLWEDADFVAEVSGASQLTEAVLDSVRTERGEYRYIAIPVELGETTPGALVAAYDRGQEMASLDGTFRSYALVAAGSLIVLAVVGWIVAGRLLRPLRALRETAGTITDSGLSRRIPAEGSDDISELARTFNGMLGRLEASFASQRRLLDDAGHELRTPITIVRGHLELMDPDDRQDATETRALALSELDRMHRLADDLVMLAKADAPGFVQPVPAEVGTMLDNVLDQARRLGDRRWRIVERAEARTSIDRQRLTQAMLQLAANAAAASPAGSTVAFGSRLESGWLRLWVRDEGTGIPAEEHERIFERFTRGSSSSHPDGSGLGLSIVAAIAEGHGGHVEVTSSPGHGSCFTLHLPAPDAVLDDEPDDEIVVEADPTPARSAGTDEDGAR